MAGEEEDGYEIDMGFRDVVEDVGRVPIMGEPYHSGNWNAYARTERAQVEVEGHLGQGEVVDVSRQHSCSNAMAEEMVQSVYEGYKDRVDVQVINVDLHGDLSPDHVPYLESQDAAAPGDTGRAALPRLVQQGLPECLLETATFHYLAAYRGQQHLP